MAKRLAHGEVLNLDDPAKQPWTLVTTYKGVRTTIDRDRLETLLDLEQAALTRVAGGHADEGGDLSFRNRQLPDERVSHASLSTRITKIYNYGQRDKALRPAHAGILGEFLAAFDWNLPDNLTNRIPTLLDELKAWDGISADLKAQIVEFLAKYERARTRSAG